MTRSGHSCRQCGTRKQLWELRGDLGRRGNQGRLPGGGGPNAETEGAVGPAHTGPEHGLAGSRWMAQAPLTTDSTKTLPPPSPVAAITRKRANKSRKNIRISQFIVHPDTCLEFLCNRNLCDDGNVLRLHHPGQWPRATLCHYGVLKTCLARPDVMG